VFAVFGSRFTVIEMSIQRFEEIESWQMAREVCNTVFRLVGECRNFSLKDQMLRSSGSIMDNIAEGFDAGSNREFIRFLQYAKRSCSELQSQLYRCIDQKLISQDEFDEHYSHIDLIKKKIGSFINYLSRNIDHRKVSDPR